MHCTVKRLFLFLLSSLLLCACAKETTVELVRVSDTGCSTREIIATKSGGGADSQLILEYSAQGLVITRTNALLNCSVRNGGVGCNVSNSGNTIECEVFENDQNFLRCNCRVGAITSVIGGLRLGEEYTLYHHSDGVFGPVVFTYTKDLRMVLDADQYMH